VSRLALYSIDGSPNIVMDVETLRVVEPVSVRNVFDEYDGREIVWRLEPNRKYLVISMIRLVGGGYDVWVYLCTIPRDNTILYEKKRHFWAKTIASAVGKALKDMKLLKKEEIPPLIN